LTKIFVESCVDFEVAHFIRIHGLEIAVPQGSHLKAVSLSHTAVMNEICSA